MRLPFERMHLRIGKAEVMADFVNHHMRDERLKADPRLAPFGKQRLAVEGDARGQLSGSPDRFVLQGAALVEAGQLPGILDAELFQRLFVGELLDVDGDALEMPGERLRNPREGGPGKGFEVRRRWGGAETEMTCAGVGRGTARCPPRARYESRQSLPRRRIDSRRDSSKAGTVWPRGSGGPAA